MNVPLSWISQYIELPETKILTERLTMIGHLLDKVTVVDGETVIDLELRGNRADLFGIVGIARDISAAFNIPLRLPPVVTLPKTDPACSYVKVDKNAADLVQRYTAVRLKVKIGPSPEFIVKHLAAYGLPSINNVVDITNYVMVETGEPMHAFDYHLLVGGKLILRRATEGEIFQTIQQGTSVTLSHEDLTVRDGRGVQALTMIGGLHSGVKENTKEILLEAAVYNQANCRRSSRRLKITTDSSLRHEKFLDPNGVKWALERAIYLLEKYAGAEVTSLTSDYYPDPVKEKTVGFDAVEIKRLGGVEVPISEVGKILKRLEFVVRHESGNKFPINVPSFRTDIEGPADVVEEILRIYGYEKIPFMPLSDAIPEPNTYPTYAIQEKLRDCLVGLGLSEVITLSMVPNELAPGGITLVNPPDPSMATLRTRLTPSLVSYAKRLTNLNQERVAIFEIGKVFHQKLSNHVKKEESSYSNYYEQVNLGIALSGMTENKRWNNQPRLFSVFDLEGIIDRLRVLLGARELEVEVGSWNGVFWAEVNVSKLLGRLPPFTNPYTVASPFPPVIEDMNFTLEQGKTYASLIERIKKTSPLIVSVVLVDKYGEKLTLGITYHSPKRQLSSGDIEPIRKKLLSMV